jgi:hypothetical protein
MKRELFDTVVKLFESEIRENVKLASNIALTNKLTDKQSELLFNVVVLCIEVSPYDEIFQKLDKDNGRIVHKLIKLVKGENRKKMAKK